MTRALARPSLVRSPLVLPLLARLPSSRCARLAMPVPCATCPNLRSSPSTRSQSQRERRRRRLRSVPPTPRIAHLQHTSALSLPAHPLLFSGVLFCAGTACLPPALAIATAVRDARLII